MRFFKLSGALFFLALHGQAQDAGLDSLELEEVLIIEHKVTAGDEFKHRNIDADSLITGRANLSQALTRSTPVFLKSYGINGVSTISLRGTSANHTKVFWNDLDLGSPMLGQTDLSSIPLMTGDQIDIQYGFASLNDATGGIGGSIRLNNNYAASQSRLLEASVFTGSFGQFQGRFSANLKFKKLRVQIGGLKYAAENDFSYTDISEPGNPESQMQNADIDQDAYWMNLYYVLAKNQLISLKTWYNKLDRDLPPNLNGNQEVFDQMLDEALMSVMEYVYSGAKAQLKLTSGLVRSDNQFYNGTDQDSDRNSFLSWQNSLRFKTSLGKHLKFETGGRFRIEEARSPSYQEPAVRNQGSVFGKLNRQIGSNLNISFLLREEWVNGQASPLLGSIGVVWSINEVLKNRLSLARNYRVPTLNDLYWSPGGNMDLMPESSYNFEYGLAMELSEGLVFDLNLFHNLIDNWIQWTLTNSVWSPDNIKKVANTGLEVQLMDSHKLKELKIHWQLAYSYTRSATLDTYGTNAENTYNQLPYVPFHVFNAGVELHYQKYWIRYQQNVNGSYFTNSDNSIYMPAYYLGNISLGWNNLIDSKKHRMDVCLELNNIWNYEYQLLPFRPQPGRNFGIRLNYLLSK